MPARVIQGPVAGDQAPHLAPRGVVRGDRGAEGDPAVLGDLAGHVADPADVQVPVLLRERELRRQVPAHDVAVQEGRPPPAPAIASFATYGAKKVTEILSPTALSFV